MTFRSALTVVGEAVGSAYGGPWGAAIGGAFGGFIGGIVDGPTQNTQAKIDDLSALKFDYGSAWPRLYGTDAVNVTPMWTSTQRSIKHSEEQDGKGGPGQVNTTWTYVRDCMFWAPLGSAGFSRVWRNGELIYSALGDSDDTSVQASLNTSAWGSILFMDGNPTQMPWTVYEAAVGTANASAYRHRPMLCIEALDTGSSGTMPLLKVEFFSAATADTRSFTELIYEVDLTTNLGNDSGMGAYLGAGGHVWFGGEFGGSFLGKSYLSVTYNLAFPPPGNQVMSEAGQLPPDIGTTANFATGLADESSFWMAAGSDGFRTRIRDSNGVDYPANYPTNATDRWVAMLTYARYGGVTLGLLAAPFQGITILNANHFASTAYQPLNATFYAGEWYVLPTAANGNIYKYAAADLAPDGTIADPRGNTGAVGGALLTDKITGALYLVFGADTYKWSGSAWSVYIASMPLNMRGMDMSTTPHGLTMDNGTLWALSHITGSEPPYRYQVSKIQTLVTVDPDDALLSDILTSEATLSWTGETGALSSSDIDVSAHTATAVRGYMTTGAPVDSLAQLADVFYFGLRCSDKVYMPLRGASSIGTVPFADTGMAVGQPGTPFTGLDRGNDLEVAMQTAVTGPDVFTDYDPDTQISDRLIGESVELRRYTTAVVFTPNERKGRAQTMNLDGRAASHIGKVIVDDRHVEKEPFDVFTAVDDQGNSYRVRALGETFGDCVHDFDVCLDDPTVLVSSGITTSIDQRAITVREVPLTTVVPLDVPIFREVDNSRGIYVAAKPATAAGWAGYSFDESADGVTYSSLGKGTLSTVIGFASTVPGAFTGGRVFDEVDRIVVDVGEGTLTSATKDQIIANPTVNAFALGAHGRWLLGQFRDATLTAPGIYELRGLLLGSLGTEQHIGTSIAGDIFVLLQASGGVIRVPQTSLEHDALRYYRGVSIGRSGGSSGSATITEEEVGLMPLSVIRQRIVRDSSGNATISGQRRTRMPIRYTGSAGVLVPIGEETEAYSVDIFADNTFADVVRVLSSSTPSVVYSAADQVTDFGSLQDPIYARIYQLSASVGRGFPAEVAT